MQGSRVYIKGSSTDIRIIDVYGAIPMPSFNYYKIYTETHKKKQNYILKFQSLFSLQKTEIASTSQCVLSAASSSVFTHQKVKPRVWLKKKKFPLLTFHSAFNQISRSQWMEDAFVAKEFHAVSNFNNKIPSAINKQQAFWFGWTVWQQDNTSLNSHP